MLCGKEPDTRQITGHLEITLLSGNFNKSSIISKMSPQVEIKVGNVTQKSCKKTRGGQEVSWAQNNTFNFVVRAGDRGAYVKAYHKRSILPDSIIGNGYIDIEKYKKGGQYLMQQIIVVKNNVKNGWIFVNINYKPKIIQTISHPTTTLHQRQQQSPPVQQLFPGSQVVVVRNQRNFQQQQTFQQNNSIPIIVNNGKMRSVTSTPNFQQTYTYAPNQNNQQYSYNSQQNYQQQYQQQSSYTSIPSQQSYTSYQQQNSNQQASQNPNQYQSLPQNHQQAQYQQNSQNQMNTQSLPQYYNPQQQQQTQEQNNQFQPDHVYQEQQSKLQQQNSCGYNYPSD